MDMAAATKENLDLATVKELFIQKVTGFGFKKSKDAIFEWCLTISDPKIFQSKTHYSDSFVITNGDLYGELTLRYSTNENNSGYKLSLILTDLLKKDVGIHQLDPLQFFVCNVKTNYSASDGKHYEHCVLNLNADENDELSCAFNVRDTVTNLTVELYEETFVTVDNPWPCGNVAVGKIDNFYDKMLQEDYDNDILSVSPTFHFESSNLLMMVEFSKVLHGWTTSAKGLSATLHILGANGPSELPLYYAVTFTIFSQQKERNVKDLVRKVVFRREENKTDFTTLLAFYHDLKGCYDDGDLYYKVLVEPHPTK